MVRNRRGPDEETVWQGEFDLLPPPAGAKTSDGGDGGVRAAKGTEVTQGVDAGREEELPATPDERLSAGMEPEAYPAADEEAAAPGPAPAPRSAAPRTGGLIRT